MWVRSEINCDHYLVVSEDQSNSLFSLMILECGILVTKSICQKSSIHAAANLQYILTVTTPVEYIVLWHLKITLKVSFWNTACLDVSQVTRLLLE